MKLSSYFTLAERRVLHPPQQHTVSSWADEHRVLDPVNHANPGPWRTDFAPYLRGIMDAYADPTCRDVIVLASTQVGKTESMLNCLLFSVDQDPAPIMVVLPTEDDAVSFNRRRLQPSVDHCPPVRRRKTERKADWKNHELGFDSCLVYMAWSQSASKLASRSIGRLFMDEVDKYPAFTGREADPISLATERLRMYRDRKRYLCSTPTTEEGNIWRLWLGSDQRHYLVPCPHCAHFQRLTLPRIRFGDERDPAKIEAERLASFECEECERLTPDDFARKAQMMARGVWVPDGATVDAAGEVQGDEEGPVRGFHVNALYSPSLTWSEVAAEFLRSKDDPQRQLNFQNSWMGWPWVKSSESTTLEQLATRTTTFHPGTVPRGAVVLTAGVDVQKRGFYWAVRAWGVAQRSWLVDAGFLASTGGHPEEDWDALGRLLLTRTFPVVDEHGEERDQMPVRLVCVDSGYRTDEVYRWTAANSERARPVKGQQSARAPYRATRIETDWWGKARGHQLWHVDTTYMKDLLHRLQSTEMDQRGAWMLNADPDPEYLKQVTSEHKVPRRRRGTGDYAEVWVLRPGAGGNHLLDAEVYALAAAEMLHVATIQTEEAAREVRGIHRRRPTPGGPMRDRDDDEDEPDGGRKLPKKGWINRGRK